jgi:hypothetical protein
MNKEILEVLIMGHPIRLSDLITPDRPPLGRVPLDCRSGNFHPNNGAVVFCNPNHPRFGQRMGFEEQLEYFGFRDPEANR